MFKPNSYTEILDFIKKSNKKTKIVAVSKNHSQVDIKKALDFGVKLFGENRVQEAKDKFFELKKNSSNIELHLTGPLQTNKVKAALSIFDVFQ